MQTSDFPRQLGIDEDADNSQKTAQNEGSYSSLASASTGMMTVSLHGSNTGSQTCKPSPVCTFGEKSIAKDGYTILLEDDPYLDHCYAKDNNILHMRKGPRRSLKQNLALLCSVIVMLCLGSVALCFCVHLHYQMRDQNQMVQTVLKNFSSLSHDYEALRDDNLRLRKEFDNYRMQNEMPMEATEEDDAFSSTNDQAMQSSDAVSQLLRSNGLPESVSNVFQRRAKRSAAERQYIESIVINYLRRMPKIHLKGINNITSTNEYRGPQNQYLVWQADPESVHRGVTVKHVHHQHNRIKAIEIEQTGVYVVYSQVIINGTTNNTWRRDCAHQTVVLPYHDDNDRDDVAPHSFHVLLSGFLTQDAQGRYEDHSIPFPRDSSLQMGMFKLLRQSQVRVRVPESEDCRRTLFTTDLHSSYFGLFRIA